MFDARETREMIEARRIDALHGMDLATADCCRIAERMALSSALTWLALAERTFAAPSGPSEYMLDVLSVGLWRHGQEIDWAIGRMVG